MMTYKALYEWGSEELQIAQIEDARLDARLLLEYTCGTNRNDLLVHGERVVESELETIYRDRIQKRKCHIPLQHITGVQEFMGLEFRVSDKVLIPRQDTEILVEEAMIYIHDGMRILDICTGSGCILLSLLHYKNDCTGVGLDISADALEVARENAEKLGIEAQWIQSDLLEKTEGKFDIIVSNPPYIKTDVIPTLSVEVNTYEPQLALDGKEDGLEFYRRISRECKSFLNRGGMLFFEIGYDQAKDVSQIMEREHFCDIRTIKDFAGLDRVVTGIFLEELCLID